MSIGSQIQNVVSATFARLGERKNNVSCAPLVLRDGRCVGQTFQSAQFRAIWLSDRGVIIVFRRGGGLVTTMSVGEALAMPANAA